MKWLSDLRCSMMNSFWWIEAKPYHQTSATLGRISKHIMNLFTRKSTVIRSVKIKLCSQHCYRCHICRVSCRTMSLSESHASLSVWRVISVLAPPSSEKLIYIVLISTVTRIKVMHQHLHKKQGETVKGELPVFFWNKKEIKEMFLCLYFGLSAEFSTPSNTKVQDLRTIINYFMK